MTQRAAVREARPTSKDVAALAGVAQSTVSYVMTGKRAVQPETRQRVEEAMRKLSYHPNSGARALRGARTNVIALVMHLGSEADLSDSIPYIETIIEEARRREWDVVLSTADGGPRELERIAGRRIADAFVLMDVRTHDGRLATAAAIGSPVVLFGRPADALGLDAVDFNTRRAAEMLVDELADTGHRHIALVGESPAVYAQDLRFIREFHEGGRERASARGIDLEVVERSRDGWAGVAGVADRLLAHERDGLGIIVRSPQVTEWLVQLLLIRGLRVGSDVSLVGLCTDATAEKFESAVTNVSPQPRDLSRRAMHTLFRRIDGDAGPAALELIDPEGVVRRATTAEFS